MNLFFYPKRSRAEQTYYIAFGEGNLQDHQDFEEIEDIIKVGREALLLG